MTLATSPSVARKCVRVHDAITQAVCETLEQRRLLSASAWPQYWQRGMLPGSGGVVSRPAQPAPPLTNVGAIGKSPVGVNSYVPAGSLPFQMNFHVTQPIDAELKLASGTFGLSAKLVDASGKQLGMVTAGGKPLRAFLPKGGYTLRFLNPAGPHRASFGLSITPTRDLSQSVPTNLAATAWGGNSAHLRWNDRAPNELGYRVEMTERGKASGWRKAAVVGTNHTSAVVTGLKPNTAYDFRVSAVNGNHQLKTYSLLTAPMPAMAVTEAQDTRGWYKVRSIEYRGKGEAGWKMQTTGLAVKTDKLDEDDPGQANWIYADSWQHAATLVLGGVTNILRTSGPLAGQTISHPFGHVGSFDINTGDKVHAREPGASIIPNDPALKVIGLEDSYNQQTGQNEVDRDYDDFWWVLDVARGSQDAYQVPWPLPGDGLASEFDVGSAIDAPDGFINDGSITNNLAPLVPLTVSMTRRGVYATYNNELAWFPVNGPDHSLTLADGETILPGDARYSRRALELATALFRTGTPLGTSVQINAPAGSYLSFLLVQNDTLANARTGNPDNVQGASPLHFYLPRAANPDPDPRETGLRYPHFQKPDPQPTDLWPGEIEYQVEDLVSPVWGWNDEDFDDMVFTIRPDVPVEPTLPAVTLAATDSTATEAGPTAATFTLTRAGGDVNQPLTVFLNAPTGTATEGADYTGLPRTVTFAAGQSSVPVTFTAVNDALDEPDESVFLTLAAGTSYTVGTPGSATATITDNDDPPQPVLPVVSIQATDPTATETGPTSATFTITRTGVTTQPLTVNLLAPTGTASEGTDYPALPRAVTIAAGQSSVPVTFTAIDDTLSEQDETVLLTLVAGSVYIVGSPNSATATIADNDEPSGTLTVDLDLFEDDNADGIHDNSAAAELDEATSPTPLPHLEDDSGIAQLALIVRNATPDTMLTFDYDPAELQLYRDSWGVQPINAGQTVSINELASGEDGTFILFALSKQAEQGQSSQPMLQQQQQQQQQQGVNVTAQGGGQQATGRGMSGGTARQPLPPPPGLTDNTAWRDGIPDTGGGLDDGDGSQPLTDRDGPDGTGPLDFWDDPRNQGRRTLIMAFAGHTQSRGFKGTRGNIWDVAQGSGIYQIADNIRNTYNNFAVTLFPEDPGNQFFLNTDRCGDGVLGRANPFAAGDARVDAGGQATGALAFITDAITQHNVTNIGLVGYSHGGGSVQLLVQALAQEAWRNDALRERLQGIVGGGVNFFWTGYIDAVNVNLTGTGDSLDSYGTPFSEIEFPIEVMQNVAFPVAVGTVKHFNIYQRGAIPPWRDGTIVDGDPLDPVQWSDVSDGWGRDPIHFEEHFTDTGAGTWPQGLDHTNKGNSGRGIAEDDDVQRILLADLAEAVQTTLNP